MTSGNMLGAIIVIFMLYYLIRNVVPFNAMSGFALKWLVCMILWNVTGSVLMRLSLRYNDYYSTST